VKIDGRKLSHAQLEAPGKYQELNACSAGSAKGMYRSNSHKICAAPLRPSGTRILGVAPPLAAHARRSKARTNEQQTTSRPKKIVGRRRIAVNIARLPELVRRRSTRQVAFD
jgi:hypothetical protein